MAKEDVRRERHESYATIVVGRNQSTGTRLFDSDLTHQHTVTLSVHPAHVTRRLNENYVIPDAKPLFEVEMTVQQWANAVASPGLGEGTPVTLRKACTEGWRVMEDPPESVPGDNPDTFREELESHLRERIGEAHEALRMLREMKSGKSLRKGDLEAAEQKLERALARLPDTADFIKGRFEEAMENNVASAKQEIDAHAAETLRKAGLESLSVSGGQTFLGKPGGTSDGD